MSNSTHIKLPHNVRIRDVASVIGRLLGCEAERAPLSGGESWYADVTGVSAVVTAGSAGCAWIEVLRPSASARSYLYHFEAPCGRLLMPTACAEAIALGKGLVDFFGGSVDFNDCDSAEDDYVQPAKTDAENRPEDGAEWRSLQERIMAVRPMTVTLCV